MPTGADLGGKMALYKNTNGETIETVGTEYRLINSSGELKSKADISPWSNSAERWIDNDIQSGYYKGFKKVEA